MNQRAYQQFDPKTLEALKAARNQVVQADKGSPRSRESEASGSAVKSMAGGQNPSLKQVPHQGPAPEQVGFAPLAPLRDLSLTGLEARPAESGTAAPTERRSLPLTGFAEEFIQKLASIEQEKAAVDEEMAKAEKLWSILIEKKKQLEARSIELIKVKDKLKELDKEMTDFLSKSRT